VLAYCIQEHGLDPLHHKKIYEEKLMPLITTFMEIRYKYTHTHKKKKNLAARVAEVLEPLPSHKALSLIPITASSKIKQV
jgi:hypothetical protein